MKLPLVHRSNRKSRGQALVEMALILPLIALLLVMAIDFGRVFFGWVALQNVARVGANYAAQNSDANWSNPADPKRVAYSLRMTQDAQAINCALPSPLPLPGYPDGTALNDRAVVNLTCGFTLLTPLAGNLLGNPITIAADAIFPIRSGVINGAPIQTAIPSASASASSSGSASASASASGSASASASASPSGCQVPQFIGDPHNNNNLKNKWSAAGFVKNNMTISGGNWAVVGSQSLVGGTYQPCNSTNITVGP